MNNTVWYSWYYETIMEIYLNNNANNDNNMEMNTAYIAIKNIILPTI